MLDIALLGSFRVAIDGRSIGDGLPRRCVALLACVLLRRPNRMYRERLAATLWPDVTDSEARGKLRRHIYLIGQAIPEFRRDGWFTLDGTTIGWNPDVLASIDVELLRDAVRAEAWHAAVAAYGGDLLAEFDDEWLFDERQRLREQHLINLERSALAYCAANAHAAAISTAAELLRLEPLREAAVRLLMELRFITRDRSGAIAEYERFAQRLRDELDVEPMPETSALYTNLVRRTNAELDRPDPRPQASLSANRGAPFVGRESQLATLREIWARALQARGGIAFVGGESGAGKTRLVAELDALVAADGGIVLRGFTTFVESGPYQAIFEALRSAAALLSHERTTGTAWSAVLQSVIPEFGAVSDAATVSALDAEAERNRLYESVVVAFESLAFRRPVLLVLEDLHWAGNTTIAMLGHLARRIQRSPLAIVITYRDDDLTRAHPLRELRRQLGREDNVALVPLGPLTPSDVERFLQLRFGSEGVSLGERYHEATDGLPLFLVELLADAAVDGVPALPPAQLPRTLEDMIEHRLADLTAGARTTLEIASVIGSGFDAELIVETTGWSEAETIAHLDDLLAKHVVRERPGGGSTYAFAHEYYRESSYARIDETKRRHRHARVARALEDLYPGRVSELSPQLASHFEAAGDIQRAIAYFSASARNALAVFANEDVVALTTRALALPLSQRDELDLLLLHEEALRRTGQRQAQRADLDRAEPLAVVLGDDEALCEIVHRRISLFAALTERELERAELDRADTLASAQVPSWAARFALARGTHLQSVSDFRGSRANLERAARAFEALGDARGAFVSFLKLATLERISMSFDVAEHQYANAERQLAAMHDPRSLLMALYEDRASFATARQRYLDADAWARRFLAVAEEVGDVDGRARAHRHIGSAAAWRRDVTTARDHLGRAFDLFKALEDRYNVYNVSAEFGLLMLWLGRVDEAVVRFEQAIETARSFNYAYGVVACTVNMSYALYVAGDFEAAASRSSDVMRFAGEIAAENLRGPALVNLGASLRELGRHAEAIEKLKEAATLAEGAHLEDLASEALSQLALALAATGSRVDSLEAAEHAGRLMADVPYELRTGERYWVLARAYARAGEADLARAALRDGKTIVLAQLASIPDEESRRTFGLLPAHRALLIDSVESALSDALRTALA